MWLLVFTGMDNLFRKLIIHSILVVVRNPMDIIFSDFERNMYRLTDIRRDEYSLSIKIRYPTRNNQYDVHDVTVDHSLYGMKVLSRNSSCLVIYVEKQVVVSQSYYSRMLNSEFDVNILFSVAEREPFYVDIQDGANMPRLVLQHMTL